MDLPPDFSQFEKFSGPARCSHKDCIAPARFVMQIKMWAKGYPKTSTPITARFSIKVCPNHKYDVTPETFWTVEGKARIRDAIAGVGRAEPNFDSAEFEWVPL